MLKKTYMFICSEAIHARTSTTLVNSASKFKALIYILVKNKKVNLKSIMGVMSLHMNYGDEFVLEVEEEKDGKKAFEELNYLITSLKIGRDL